MPSPIVHTTAGYVMYRLFRRQDETSVRRPDLPLLATTFFFSTLPDVDVALGFWYRDMVNFHNQESHSLLMGLFIALLFAALLAIRRYQNTWRLFGIALSCYSLHVILDSLIPSRGVMLFWPLSEERFASPVPFFYQLQWSEGLWSASHIVTISHELFVSAIALGIVTLFLRRRRHSARQKQFTRDHQLPISE